MVGPKLAAELTGPAKRMIVGQASNWLSYQGGTERLLEHLRQGLGKPRLSELSDHLGRLFKGTRRRNGESINEYLTKKSECYMRAQQAMVRLLPPKTEVRINTYRNYPEYQGTWSRRTSLESTAEEVGTASQDEATATATTEQASEDQRHGWQPWWTSPSWGSSDWQNSSWSWQIGGSYWSWGNYDQSWEPPKPVELPELLPDVVQGWMLLQDANLDHQERNLVQTAAGGDFSVARISQELRAHFPEVELKKRDSQRKHASYWGEAVEEFDETPEETEVQGFSAEEFLNEEGQILWNDASQEIQEALATLQGARRTLREARGRQHNIKLSRQYYKNAPTRSAGAKGASGSSGSGERNRDEKMTCLKCGRMGHRAAHCPDKDQAAHHVQEEAPFVFFAEGQDPTPSEMACATEVTTAQAVEQGKCVIDSGATKTLGSVSAVERLMQIRAEAQAAPESSKWTRPTGLSSVLETHHMIDAYPPSSWP